MYAMITGHRPVEAPARVLNDSMKKIAEIADRRLFSDQVLHAIDWALIPEDTKRPQSIAELARALPINSAAPARVTLEEQTVLHVPPPEPISIPPSFDAAILTDLESALAAHLGPMAHALVRRKAKVSATLDGLRTALATDIESEPSRRVFMDATKGLLKAEPAITAPDVSLGAARTAPTMPTAQTQSAATPRFDDAFLAAVETELAHHLGPLARVPIKKSAAMARDCAELFLMLSDHIADETQRRAFIRKSVAAFKDNN